MNLSSAVTKRVKMDVTKKQLKAIFRECTEAIEAEAEQYGLEVEDRIYNKVALILNSTTHAQAAEFANRAKQSHNIHCLTAGKRPRTPEWYDKQAVKAKSLEKSMSSKGDEEEAASHRARAERYVAEAKKLREQAHG